MAKTSRKKKESTEVVLTQEERAKELSVKYDMSQSICLQLIQQADEIKAIADEWKEKAKKIIVTKATDFDMIAIAKEGASMMAAKRIEVEKRRKKLKGDLDKKGKVVHAFAKEAQSLINPIEKHLIEQSEFVTRQYQRERKERIDKREELLKPLGVPYWTLDLGGMPEEEFNIIYEQAKVDFEESKLSTRSNEFVQSPPEIVEYFGDQYEPPAEPITDRQRAEDIAKRLREFILPEMETDEGKELISDISEDLDKLQVSIQFIAKAWDNA